MDKTEIPLSNTEVLKVLKGKISEENSLIGCEMLNYLNEIGIKEKYPMENLRDLKGLTCDPVQLVILSNTNCTDNISLQDIKLINKYIKKT